MSVGPLKPATNTGSRPDSYRVDNPGPLASFVNQKPPGGLAGQVRSLVDQQQRSAVADLVKLLGQSEFHQEDASRAAELARQAGLSVADLEPLAQMVGIKAECQASIDALAAHAGNPVYEIADLEKARTEALAAVEREFDAKAAPLLRQQHQHRGLSQNANQARNRKSRVDRAFALLEEGQVDEARASMLQVISVPY